LNGSEPTNATATDLESYVPIRTFGAVGFPLASCVRADPTNTDATHPTNTIVFILFMILSLSLMPTVRFNRAA
jgi:hypothetical protein